MFSIRTCSPRGLPSLGPRGRARLGGVLLGYRGDFHAYRKHGIGGIELVLDQHSRSGVERLGLVVEGGDILVLGEDLGVRLELELDGVNSAIGGTVRWAIAG